MGEYMGQRHVVVTAERLRGEDERDKKKRKPTLKPTDWLRSFFWGKQTSQEFHFTTPLSRLGYFVRFLNRKFCSCCYYWNIYIYFTVPKQGCEVASTLLFKVI